jgi:hypothetical protein
MAYEVLKPIKYYTKNTNFLGIPGSVDFRLEYDPTNGNVNMPEDAGNASFGTYTLFYNGKFDQYLLDRLGVSEQEKNTLYAKIQNDIRTTWTKAGGTANKKILPSWADASNQGKTPQTTTAPITAAPVQGLQGLFNLFEPGLKDIANLDFSSTNEEQLFSDRALLKYPRDILDMKQDTLQIVMYNYKAPLGDVFVQRDDKGNQIKIDPAAIINQGLERNTALKKYIGTVILPIPSGIQDNNAISWGDDTMNSMNAGIAAAAINDITKPLAGQAATAFAGLISSLKGLKLPEQSINNITAMLGSGASPDNPMFKTSVISLLLKNAGVELPPETILARGAGIVPNSNLELLFQGPTLRQFGFSWRMSPRSDLEARNVKRIIRFFKQGSAARKISNMSGTRANTLFLGTPNVFKLSYKTGNDEISGLNKFKICALVNMSVVYAPDGQWASYDKGQPVSLTMSLNFQEIEPVYEDDYRTDNRMSNTKLKDNPKVYPDDVGY